MNVLVTGGAGFIGSNLVHHLRETRPDWRVVTLDALTYAASPENLEDLRSDPQHVFVHGDLRDARIVRETFRAHAIDAVLHLAAESHVDRSISGPGIFVETNVGGTEVLLDAARELGWKPKVALEEGLRHTVDWYVAHREWSERIRNRA